MYRLIDDVAFYTAEEADQHIAQSVQTEAALREASDAACNARIADEAAAREAAEAELLDAITDETDAREGDVEALTVSIDVESAVREAADTTLQQHIDSETAARNEADSAVQGYIDTEVSARKAADNSLQAAIDVETTARKAAATTLQLNIDSEAASREAADTTLQSSIDSEASSREAADTTLQANIDAETTARESADGDLSTLVTEDKRSLVAAVNELADRNDAVAKIVAGLFQVKDVQSSSGECTVARASLDTTSGAAATLTGASFSDGNHSIVNYAAKINSVSYVDGTSFSASNLEYRICLNTNEQGNTIVHSTGWLNGTGIFYGITGLSQSNYCKGLIYVRIRGETYSVKDLKLKYTVVASRVPLAIGN